MELLYPQQKTHCERLLKILEHSLFACDFSVPGAGKTAVGAAIASILYLPLFVVGPRQAIMTWEDFAESFEVRIIHATSYDSLRSVKGKQPKHGYLKRIDLEKGVEFSPTLKLKKLIDNGVLIIIDECQGVKNASAQGKAVKGLLSYLFEGGNSRVLFLSGFPLEEHDHTVNFFRILGFIQHPMLYTMHDGEFIPLGIKELVLNLESDETAEIVKEFLPLDRNNVKALVFELFVEIIKPYFTSTMPSPIVKFKRDVGNGFYKISDKEALIKAILQLQRATAYDTETDSIDKKLNFTAIQKALVFLEAVKLEIFARVALCVLEGRKIPGEDFSLKNASVVLFVNFSKTIDDLVEILKGRGYNLLTYDGQLKKLHQERKVISTFQNGDSRLLIANIKKGGVSISLHDLVGNRPRFALMSPNFSISSLHQASNRIYRQGLKSRAVARAVYGNIEVNGDRLLETKILSALARKTGNVKRVLTRQVDEGILFPGEYPEYIEY